MTISWTKGMYISSVSSEWRSHEPKTKRRVPVTAGNFPVIASTVPEILDWCWDVEQTNKQTIPSEISEVVLLVGCLTSQQQASVSQGRICSDNFTCCHTETEVADQTFYLTQSQYTDTGPTSPSADPITPGAWQCSHWSANFEVTGMTRPRKNPGASGIRTRDLPLSRQTPYH